MIRIHMIDRRAATSILFILPIPVGAPGLAHAGASNEGASVVCDGSHNG
jgi:hypothetical protein